MCPPALAKMAVQPVLDCMFPQIRDLVALKSTIYNGGCSMLEIRSLICWWVKYCKWVYSCSTLLPHSCDHKSSNCCPQVLAAWKWVALFRI